MMNSSLKLFNNFGRAFIQQIRTYRSLLSKRSVKAIRYLILAIMASLVAVSVTTGCTQGIDKGQQVVRIADSKFGSPVILKKLGSLEKRLAERGYAVEWHEFAAGPQSLEALNAGSLDLTWTAESPVIFAQAAGTPLVYIATTTPNPQTAVFLVPQNSPIKSVADLKGKKIALQKASIAQYLLVNALKEVGLTMSDVQPVYLPPPDANIAFSQSQVDAWIIWEPYISRAEQKNVGRILRDGKGLLDVGLFYSASRSFVERHSDLLKIYLEELQKAESWSKEHTQEWAEALSSTTGIDVPTLKTIHDRQIFGLLPVTQEVANKQQKVADMYLKLGMIPKRIEIREVVLPPDQYAQITPESIK